MDQHYLIPTISTVPAILFSFWYFVSAVSRERSCSPIRPRRFRKWLNTDSRKLSDGSVIPFIILQAVQCIVNKPDVLLLQDVNIPSHYGKK